MKANPDHDVLVRWLRHALRHLYDPLALQRNPLNRLLGRQEAGPSALRSILVASIEALKPAANISFQSDAWRTYHVLSQRYVQQFSQPEVATDLGLGVRQLQRQERLALRELAEYLRTHHGLAGNVLADSMPTTGNVAEEPGDAEAGSRERELAWLEKSFPSEAVTAAQVIDAALRAASALMAAAGVQAQCVLPEHLPRLAVQPATIPQALLNVLTAAVRGVPGGHLRIEAASRPGQVSITVVGMPTAVSRSTSPVVDGAEDLDMARELLALSGGTLEIEQTGDDSSFAATLTVPAAERIAVLVIDDNADTLQLFERYLAGSRYAFNGVRDPAQALEASDHIQPQIIILDVMLPGSDGWEMLGWLRERPSTRGKPIVVCTILPQEQVALTLGAAAFLRKPVSRQQLLALLDHLSGQEPKVC